MELYAPLLGLRKYPVILFNLTKNGRFSLNKDIRGEFIFMELIPNNLERKKNNERVKKTKRFNLCRFSSLSRKRLKYAQLKSVR